MKQFLFNFNGIHIISPLIVYILTFGRSSSIAIFPFVFYRSVHTKKNQLIKNRCSIHIKQQIECGLAGILFMALVFLICRFGFNFRFRLGISVILPATFFYVIIYILNYIINFLRYKKHMVRSMICFNREAYNRCNITSYLYLRKPFSWIKYI